MIKIDVSQLDGLADRLAKFGPEAVGEMVVDSLNEAVDNAYELGRRTILMSGINLTDTYLQSRMEVDHATDRKAEASVTAFGGKAYTTQLSHYGARQEQEGVTWTNSWILANKGSFGRAWFANGQVKGGWTERKGDKGRGIAADSKARGVSVEVIKGQRKRIASAITIPGKTDSENYPLVFRRFAGTRKKVDSLQGPSVYQLFRTAIPRIEDEVAQDLSDRVAAAAQKGLEDILE